MSFQNDRWNHAICDLLRLAFLLSIMPLGSIQVVGYITAESYSMVWMYHSLLRDILVVPSLGVTINKAAMNNHVQILLCV